MRYIVAAFGERYSGLLLTTLFSIRQSAPNSHVSVYWQDMSDEKIQNFKKLFPSAQFIRTDFDFSGDLVQRISSKTLMWSHACRNETDELLCFMDADMILLRDVTPLARAMQTDMIFTVKNEKVPINTGILICRNSEGVKTFFQSWLQETTKILKDETLLAQSVDEKLPYGGADQMSFYRMIGYEMDKKEFFFEKGGLQTTLEAVPCELLNHTMQKALTKEVYIVHYKGFWSALLFRAALPSTKNIEKYTIFMENFLKAAKEYIAANEAAPRDFHIKPHFLFLLGAVSAYNPLYILWRLVSSFYFGATKRLRRLLTGS